MADAAAVEETFKRVQVRLASSYSTYTTLSHL